MKKYLKIFLILNIFILSVSCAGTGTKNFSSVNFDVPTDEAAVFFVRKKKYIGSAGLVKVILDGEEIGRLGVGEMERISIKPGSHSASVKIGNILQAGVGGDAAAFIAEKGKGYYFIVDIESGFFSASWTLTETTAEGFRKALN